MQSCRSAGRKPLFILLSQSHPWRESGRISQATRQAGLEAANVCSQPVRVASAASGGRVVGFPSGRSWRTFGLALVLLSNCPPGSPGWPGSLPASPFLLALALPCRPCRPCPPRERKRKPARRKLPPVVMSSRRLTVRAVVRCLLPSPSLSLYISPSPMKSTNDNRGMRT